MESKVRKSKLESEVSNQLEVLDRDAWTRQATNWLRENGILSNYEINTMILSCYMASKLIRDVELFIDQENKHVDAKIYVGRITYLFRNREDILRNVIDGLKPVLNDKYSMNIEICLNKK